MKEQLILVDYDDNVIGEGEKIAVHQQALLHRAFSVFIFRQYENQLQLLLQQRHPMKYHCGGLWTNSCCGHPRPGEEIVAAAERRLEEEFGLRINLQQQGRFHYKAEFPNGLTENEIDHVFVGLYSDEQIKVDPIEIAQYRWIDVADLDKELQLQGDQYTPWFKPAYKIAMLSEEIKRNKG